MASTSQQRNGEIELARFFAAVVIVNCHAVFFPGCPVLFGHGLIGVEFFFFLSGFLMAASIYRKGNPACLSWGELNRETARFLWRKLSSFFPELVISCLLGIIFWGYVYPSPLSIMGIIVRTFTADILLLKTSGFAEGSLNGVSWYLASMMWGMAILYPLYRRFGLNSILPALSLVVLSRFFAASVQKETELAFLLGGSNIRGFCELACGAALFPLVKLLRRLVFHFWLRACLLVVKFSCYGIVLADAVAAIPPEAGGIGTVLVALVLIIVLSFSGVCPDANFYQRRWVFWLGRFSLPLYLSHAFYALHLKRVVPAEASSTSRLLLYYGCSFTTALLVMYLSSFVRRFFREHPNFFLKPSTER